MNLTNLLCIGSFIKFPLPYIYMNDDYKALLGPEKIIVDRLIFDEPFDIVNAWLIHNKFNPVDQTGFERIKIKNKSLVEELKASTSEVNVLNELIEMKDLLIKVTGSTEDPKAIAQLSNSINSMSKTIGDLNEKKNANKEEPIATSKEFLSILNFLKSEKLIDFSEEQYNELSKNLSATV